MKKMLEPISRMWKSLRRFFSSLTERATKGTGIAVKTVGGGAAAIMSVVVMVILLVVIAVAAIPYGVFAATNNKQEVSADASSIVDAETVETYCIKCGIADDGRTLFTKRDGLYYCTTCDDKEDADEEALEKG